MTQNIIDLAIAASNLNSPSDTASPGNTGICGGKPPFGKSLQEAMQTTDINGDTGDVTQSNFCRRQGKNCHYRARITLV